MVGSLGSGSDRGTRRQRKGSLLGDLLPFGVLVLAAVAIGVLGWVLSKMRARFDDFEQQLAHRPAVEAVMVGEGGVSLVREGVPIGLGGAPPPAEPPAAVD